MNTSDLKSFYYLENGEITFSMLDTVKTVKKMDAGFYHVNYLDQYPNARIIVKRDSNKEVIKIHNFPDKEKIDKLIASFFNHNVQKTISKLGFYHKIGVLLHGKEGTGKSTIVRYYCDALVSKQDALVFYINELGRYFTKCWEFISNVRAVQNNPIVVIIEEMDGLFRGMGEESANVKKILDGNLSISDCIFFATTNFIADIPEAIKNRPSRFKYVLNIEGIQRQSDIHQIVHKMLSEFFSETELYEFSTKLKGSSIDEIKQFCIDKIMDLKTYHKKNKVIGFLQDMIN